MQVLVEMKMEKLNLWNLYNLSTQANKLSYIDTFLDRNVNAFNFSNRLLKTLNGALTIIGF